jgi:glycosyltransferase involved in cell wall biosynthesis
VAAYNEADRIAATLVALEQAFPGAEVWVADDGSSDATAEIARHAGARVVRSPRVIGKGAAVTRAAREALRQARATTGDPDDRSIFVLCDGDLGDSARELGPLADAVGRGQADVAVAAFARRSAGAAAWRRRPPCPDSERCAGARCRTCCRSPTASAWRSG